MKKFLSFLLCSALLCGVCVFSSAAEPYYEGEFSLINMNVQGLTSLMGSDCRANSLYAGSVLSGYDIAAVQEDFNYHSFLMKNMTLPNRTYFSGITGAGDGMGIYSKFKIYNQKRVKWRSLSGVFDGGSDELTPKGILYCTLELYDGVYVDLYDIHADAYGDALSVAARKDNYIQLAELVRELSGDRAYMITGDFNYFLYQGGDMDTCLMQPLGCKDVWTQLVCDGEIPSHEDAGYSWGSYNSVERVLYKSSGTVTLEPVAHEYMPVLNPGNGEYCSDHNAQTVTMRVTASEKNSSFSPSFTTPIPLFFRGAANIFHTLYLLISQAILTKLPALWS